MKKYILYPGLGRIAPGMALGYISGRQLAACFRVPYSECLDADNAAIKKVIEFNRKHNAPPMHLLSLLPNSTGIYKAPSAAQNKILIVNGAHEAVNKNG